MNPDLKILMDRATDRPVPFTPDPGAILAAGQRRRRNRRIVGSIATLAAVAVIAGGVTVAFELQDSRGVAPANQPTTTKLCTTSNGTMLGNRADGWIEVISVSDKYGTAAILRTPDESQFAYCVTQSTGDPNVQLGARGGVLVRKTSIDPGTSMTTVFGRAYGEKPKTLVETGDGKIGTAVVKSTFYLYRHVEARPWPGSTPTVFARTLDARGNYISIGRW